MLLQAALNIFNICIFLVKGLSNLGDIRDHLHLRVYGYQSYQGSMFQRYIGCTDQWSAMATDSTVDENTTVTKVMTFECFGE